MNLELTIIKHINELIEKSLDMSDYYIRKSLQWKEEYPTLSRALYEASLDEADNYTRLHGVGVSLIQAYREKNGPPPANMQAIYDYLHEKHINHAVEIKNLQNMYKAS